mgnify:CR=1 FL=1
MPLENNFPHNPEFRPILLPGQRAKLIRGHVDNFVNVEVVHVFPLPVHRHDFGVLTASVTDQDDTHLDMPTGELAQYRYIPRGSFRVHLENPGGVDIYRTNGSTKGTQTAGFFIDPYAEEGAQWVGTDWSQWAASEFFVFEDETPRFDIYPLGPTTGGKRGYVDFYGWGFALKKALSEPPVSLWVNGRPQGVSLV